MGDKNDPKLTTKNRLMKYIFLMFYVTDVFVICLFKVVKTDQMQDMILKNNIETYI